MIPIKIMENSVGKRVKVHFHEGESINGFVNSYEYEPETDNEPMILVGEKFAFSRSEIREIEILK